MRTVSFSQPQVQPILSRDFVCFTSSTEGDPTAGESIRHRPNDPAGPCLRGNGQQNVQTLFLTPQGEIFHAASGYLSADDLLEEVRFARDLFSELRSLSAEDRIAEVRRRHRDRLVQLEFTSDEIESRGPNFGMGMNMPLTMPDLKQFQGFPGGSQPAKLQSGNPPPDLFKPFVRRQILVDHQFCLDHPCLSAASFERDPTPLLGTGKSFFMSQSSGTGNR